MKSLIRALMTITSPSAMTPQLEKQSSLDDSIIIWKNCSPTQNGPVLKF